MKTSFYVSLLVIFVTVFMMFAVYFDWIQLHVSIGPYYIHHWLSWTGTDVAIESADIILVKNDPRDVVKVAEISRKTYSKMVQNLWWAAGYNIFAIPLAAGILYNYGIIVSPAIGALLMSISTIIVALNSQTLRKYEPKVHKIAQKDTLKEPKNHHTQMEKM